eukprot:3933205-Rhodomonas_salina.1
MTLHHSPPISITLHHWHSPPSLSTTLHHSPSLSITLHESLSTALRLHLTSQALFATLRLHHSVTIHHSLITVTLHHSVSFSVYLRLRHSPPLSATRDRDSPSLSITQSLHHSISLSAGVTRSPLGVTRIDSECPGWGRARTWNGADVTRPGTPRPGLALAHSLSYTGTNN